jgi:hypothetical protein
MAVATGNLGAAAASAGREPRQAGAEVHLGAGMVMVLVLVTEDLLLRLAVFELFCVPYPAIRTSRTLQSLYLLPDGLAAQHPYLVLSQALRERRKWALGRIVLSGHRRLVFHTGALRLLCALPTPKTIFSATCSIEPMV